MLKFCTVCNLEKDTLSNNFRFLKSRSTYAACCRSCENQKNIQYKKINRNKIAAYNQIYLPIYLKQYVIDNKLELQAYRKDYKKSDKAKASHNKYERNRRRNDPSFRLRKDISRIIRRAITKNGLIKTDSVVKYLSNSIQELKEHLEKQFEPWMTWENQGRYISKTWKDDDSTTWTWQIDHIVPQSQFDFSKDEEIKKCWDLSNLRPYSSKLNVIEGDRRKVND